MYYLYIPYYVSIFGSLSEYPYQQIKLGYSRQGDVRKTFAISAVEYKALSCDYLNTSFLYHIYHSFKLLQNSYKVRSFNLRLVSEWIMAIAIVTGFTGMNVLAVETEFEAITVHKGEFYDSVDFSGKGDKSTENAD